MTLSLEGPPTRCLCLRPLSLPSFLCSGTSLFGAEATVKEKRVDSLLLSLAHLFILSKLDRSSVDALLLCNPGPGPSSEAVFIRPESQSGKTEVNQARHQNLKIFTCNCSSDVQPRIVQMFLLTVITVFSLMKHSVRSNFLLKLVSLCGSVWEIISPVFYCCSCWSFSITWSFPLLPGCRVGLGEGVQRGTLCIFYLLMVIQSIVTFFRISGWDRL